MDEVERLVKLDCLRNSLGESRCWPVGFGLIDADLDAARVAAIKEGDLDGSGAFPGGCKKPLPIRSARVIRELTRSEFPV